MACIFVSIWWLFVAHLLNFSGQSSTMPLVIILQRFNNWYKMLLDNENSIPHQSIREKLWQKRMNYKGHRRSHLFYYFCEIEKKLNIEFFIDSTEKWNNNNTQAQPNKMGLSFEVLEARITKSESQWNILNYSHRSDRFDIFNIHMRGIYCMLF